MHFNLLLDFVLVIFRKRKGSTDATIQKEKKENLKILLSQKSGNPLPLDLIVQKKRKLLNHRNWKQVTA